MKRVAQAIRLSFVGVSTETWILSVGLALVLGVCPVYGFPTLLCAAPAIILRLNLPAMQLVNVLTCPLQIALLIPFHRLGELLLPGAGALKPRIPGAVHAHAWAFFAGVWTHAVHAVAGWSCVCVPLGILLYVVIKIGRPIKLGPPVVAQS